MTNGSWSAQEAYALGLAAKVVKDEDVDAEGLAFAHQLAAAPAEVIGLSKQILLKAFESSLEDMMLYENLGQALAMSSVEYREGLAALVEKRSPDFVKAAADDEQGDGLPPTEPSKK
jgi:2-(1,2-epoxy-1,2-dihydrophenyl)acetyl-CoA isomerase